MTVLALHIDQSHPNNAPEQIIVGIFVKTICGDTSSDHIPATWYNQRQRLLDSTAYMNRKSRNI